MKLKEIRYNVHTKTLNNGSNKPNGWSYTTIKYDGNQNKGKKKDINEYYQNDIHLNKITNNIQPIMPKRKIKKYSQPRIEITFDEMELLTNKIIYESDLNQTLIEFEKNNYSLLASYRKEDSINKHNKTTSQLYQSKITSNEESQPYKIERKEHPFNRARKMLKQFLIEKTKPKTGHEETRLQLHINLSSANYVKEKDQNEQILQNHINKNSKTKTLSLEIKNDDHTKRESRTIMLNKRKLKFHDYSHQFNDLIIKNNNTSLKTNNHNMTQSSFVPISARISNGAFYYLKKYKYNYIQYLVKILERINYTYNATKFIQQIVIVKQHTKTLVNSKNTQRKISQELTVSSINMNVPSDMFSSALSSVINHNCNVQFNENEHISHNNDNNKCKEGIVAPLQKQCNIVVIEETLSDDVRSINSKQTFYQYENCLSKMEKIVKETKDIELNIKKFVEENTY